jgi:hypothetical protein
MLLIVACVCLGVLLNWGVRERNARTALFQRNADVEKSYVFVLAKRNDLATFLTDPRTKLFRLPGRNEAVGTSLTVAWQEETRTGVLVGQRMPTPPDDRTFALWRFGPSHDPTPCGAFGFNPGGTYYDFRAADGEGTNEAPSGTAGFVVSLEPRGAPLPNRPGHVVYETP